MSTGARVSWSRRRSEWLVSALALPLMFSIAGTGHNEWHLPGGWDLAMVVLTWIPLLARERRPLAVLGVVAALDAARAIVVGSVSADGANLPFASMLALYTVGTRCDSRTAVAAAAGVAALQMLVPSLDFGYKGSYLFYINWAVVSTVVGRLEYERRNRIAAAEERAAEAERTKQIEAERQVTAERVRIARELHDVLAHHITVVNAQAGVAQYLLRSDLDAAEQALSGIVANSRDALNDLRTTLGLLRDESDDDAHTTRAPTPSADQLGTLLAGFRDAGMNLTTTIHGAARPLSSAADLALYRIVQEALSNATKHAPASAVHLQIDWRRTEVSVTIANTAPAATAPPPTQTLVGEGTGHGLIGMRERAAAAGGTVATGPTPQDGYRVEVTLPVISDDASNRDRSDAQPPAGAAETPSETPSRTR